MTIPRLPALTASSRSFGYGAKKVRLIGSALIRYQGRCFEHGRVVPLGDPEELEPCAVKVVENASMVKSIFGGFTQRTIIDDC